MIGLEMAALAAAVTTDANEFAAYRTCILTNAARLERSAERAEVVADAAITACRPMKRQLIADFVNDPQRRGYMSVSEAGGLFTTMLNDTATSARSEAILQTMEARLSNRNEAQ